ncbi:MAG: hypothetical protein M1132_13345 [Chloroflexi bacterium]|nr:hypothetical protein [Chloroflexota bacterium]
MTNDAIQVENGRRNGIGIRNEKSLHAAIKQWYALPGDLLEQPVDGYIVDMVRGPLLIEIQTRNLSALRRKLHALVLHHPVRLVYPIARDKWIVSFMLGSGARSNEGENRPSAGLFPISSTSL